MKLLGRHFEAVSFTDWQQVEALASGTEESVLYN
jgi:hypothetical protein